EVVLIARGSHYEAIEQRGLRLQSAEEDVILEMAVVDHPSRIAFEADDVVILAMKSQDTQPALDALSGCAPASIAVACAQNGVAAVCGPGARGTGVYGRLRSEAEAALDAAGIDYVGAEEDAQRRGDIMTMRPIEGARRGGGSTWQSLARGLPSVETDYLNGEIVLIGRLHGVPTPVNAAMQWVMRRAAVERWEA